ncbi:universal stress protein [Hymenobacter sp. CRA2]|uniref:universal stress protein n=1 Tax=Hymenobacter sp. CRA2 TaxID=1955620 RepID=UPI00098FF72C|nr:universal stress protein [Hymenobacter sp. CRA2]OON67216.1 hypothetical protein B0919_19000 [Hymenobacter sp. CRA2]
MITFSVLMDFTPEAENALAYAVALTRNLVSRQLRAEVYLIVPLPTATDPAAPYFPHTAGLRPAGAARRLHQHTYSVAQQVPCRSQLLTGPLDESLPALLDGSRSNVVVLGRPADDDGTAAPATALYLVQLLQQPLLIVPADFAAPAAAPSRVALDTDCQPVRLPANARHVSELLLCLLQDSRVLYLGAGRKAAARLLTELIPKAVGIHVYTANETAPAPEQLLQRFDEMGFLHELPHTVQTTYHSCVEEGIIETALANGAELLLFVARQRTLAGQRFEDSATAQLMQHCPIPALVVPEAAPVRWTRYA